MDNLASGPFKCHIYSMSHHISRYKNDSQACFHFKHLLTITSLFVLFAPEPGVGIGDLDGQLSSPLHDQLPVLGGHVVGDLSAVCPLEVKGDVN